MNSEKQVVNSSYFWWVVVLIALVLTLAACGGPAPTPNPTSTTISEQEAEAAALKLQNNAGIATALSESLSALSDQQLSATWSGLSENNKPLSCFWMLPAKKQA